MITINGLMMIEEVLNAIYEKKKDFSDDEKIEMVAYVENFYLWNLWLELMEVLKYKKQDMYDAIESKFIEYSEDLDSKYFSENFEDFQLCLQLIEKNCSKTFYDEMKLKLKKPKKIKDEKEFKKDEEM